MRVFRSRTEKAPDLKSWAAWRWFDIYKGDLLYLTRLTLFRCPWFQVMLHWINMPDQDPDVHDHPWSFCSFLLRGSYREVVGRPVWWGLLASGPRRVWLYDIQYRDIRWFNRKDVRTAHSIVDVSPGGVLSLLVTGPKRKSWGFYALDTEREMKHGNVPVQFFPWREYLQQE